MAKRSNRQVDLREIWQCPRCGAAVELVGRVFRWEADSLNATCLHCQSDGFPGTMWPMYDLGLITPVGSDMEGGGQDG